MSIKLTDDVKLEVLRLHNDGYSSRQIAEVLGIGKSTCNDFLSKMSHAGFWETFEDKPVASGSKYDHWNNLKKLPGNRFIITSAQNNTYVHSEFLQSLEQAADYYNAQIIVSTYTYNKTGFQNLTKDDDLWYDPKLQQYILNEPVLLADDLVMCGELNIIPTAVNPLSGMHSYTRTYSGIIPHAKLQMESLPGHKQKGARSLFTTGTVTQRNYIEQKAGQKSSFHHVFSALLVEIDNEGDWFVRQLVAETDSGEFYDLNVKFSPKGIQEGHSVEAIVYGDCHAEKKNDKACKASFGKDCDSMLDVLKPKYQFVHDVIDFTTRNHHNRNDPYFRWKTYRQAVDADFKVVGEMLTEMQRDFTETQVVESNHHEAVEKWLREGDYKNDSPENALTFLKMQAKIVESIIDNSNLNIFEWYLKELFPSLRSVNFLELDESFMVCGEDGIECGSHGHVGNSGARGSTQAFQKLGNRHVIGHQHSPGVKDGVYVVGVLGDLDMGYNSGGSAWQAANCVIYKNGKRSLVFLKNGKWRA